MFIKIFLAAWNFKVKRFLRKFREVKNDSDNKNTHELYVKVVLFIAGQLIKKIINVYFIGLSFL